MLTRRIALPIAALTAVATLPLLAGAAPVGASGAVVQPVVPASRGGGPGNGSGDPKGPQKKSEEPPNNCPTAQWTIPLEVKGLACILLLPKPEKKDGDTGGSSGLGGLLG
jgi:hypothetical protein